MRPSEALEKNRDRVLEIIARYPVSNPRIFGSVARGEDVEGSDIDILVDIKGPMSYFDIFDLEEELASILACQVEVGTKLKRYAAETAANDLRPI